MKDIVTSLHMSMSDREIAEYMEVMEGDVPGLRPAAAAAGQSAAGALSAHAGLSPRRRRESAQRVGGEIRSARRRLRSAGGQARRAQGQCVPRRRADDERRLDARRLRARMSTRRSSRAFSMPAARSSARRTASTSACPAAAIPPRSGPVHNPYKHGYSAGGSSSGSRRAGRRRRSRDGASAATRADRSACPPAGAAATA